MGDGVGEGRTFVIRVIVMAAVLALGFASPAAASIVLSPTMAQAGQTVDLRVVVSAENMPITRVELTFSDPSIEQADAAFVAGWSTTLDRDSNDRLLSVAWDKGEIAAGDNQTFLITLIVPASSDRIAMTALQVSADGTVERVPVEGQSFGLSVSGAASTTTTVVTTTTTAAPIQADSESGSGIGLYLIMFGVVIILVIYVRTKRRIAKLK